MYLDLSKYNNQNTVGHRPIVKNSTFTGGEVDLRIDLNQPLFDDRVDIYTQIKNSDDVMALLLAVDLIRKKDHTIPINLLLPYLPYARQDRHCSKEEPFGLKVFANLINSQNFNKVKFFDVHSNVATALINRSENVTNHQYIFIALKTLSKLYNKRFIDFSLVSPDAGAYKKILDLETYLDKIECVGSTVSCLKTRGADGRINQILVNGDINPDKDYVIVDDICDAGNTFIHLAKKLREMGARNIHLIVSHGIFSYNAIDNIYKSGIMTISTTNSWPSEHKNQTDKFFIFEIKDFLRL
jgi:ribose-phosphate pyrophosphokinase